MKTTDPSVSLIVINWNGAKYLDDCLNSALAQTHPFKECLLVDNASTDDSVTRALKLWPQLTLLRNSSNLGFGQAANRGIALSTADFVLLLNPDVTLAPDFVEQLMREAAVRTECGSFGGKLLRFAEADTPPVIDSAGLVLLKNRRRPWDRGFGETDAGQYEQTEEVFGINGAAVCYRRKMLEDVRLGGECFDPEFFIYFEDVDLAWRARWLGWKSLYVPRAVARHARGGLQGEKQFSIRAEAAKNRYLVYFKNESPAMFRKHLWANLGIEVLRLAGYALREPSSLTGFFRFLSARERCGPARDKIQSSARAGTEDLLRWLT